MNLFNIPVSAIRTAQQAMASVSSNLANASTPGYHLQRVLLAETEPVYDQNLRIGAGVQVAQIQRQYSAWIEQSLLTGAGSTADTNAQLDAAKQLDSYFNPTDSSIQSRANDFFNAWQALSSSPEDSTLRRDLLSSADALATEINSLHDNLANLTHDIDLQVNETVDQINSLSKSISALNQKIQIGTASGQQVNDLLDQRDQMVSQLSELVDVKSLDAQGQTNTFSAANGALIIDNRGAQLKIDTSSGKTQILVNGVPSPLPAGSGRLAGLLSARDGLVADAQSQLSQWADALTTTLNELHAQGLGLDGPHEVLTSGAGASDPAANLSASLGASSVSPGNLTITVTDSTTGARSAYRIPIEPGLDSLNSVAAKISGIAHLKATVSPDTGQLTIVADQGYGFEFTGRLATQPDTSAWTGTSAISLSGSYTGATNSDWKITLTGSGTVGVTPGLRAEVRDANGNLKGTFNIGQGYAAGDKLTTADGVSIQFGSGTVVAADSAKFQVTANPDESNFLSAIGMNALFVGGHAGNLSINQSLIDDPSLLAAARSDQVGDNANAKIAAGLATQRFAGLRNQSFTDFLGQMTADIGSDAKSLQASADQLASTQADLTAQQQSSSGVDPNEELVKLLEYQRLFQSGARFIATVNQTLDDLFNIIR
jgi:flagellar hook-associated protein FlgK